ncbi:MAG: hypothetical protein KKE20_02560 [Nanoarchaeota archaeon]|nr:hypothetical protein [Nanoarchaeota archaeon]
MYGCRSGGCGNTGSHRPKPLYSINPVRPDRPSEMYAKPWDIMDMYKRANGLGIEQSGGSYQRIKGPDPLVGYAQGTSNSGSLGSIDYGAIAKAASMYDFGKTYN